MKHAIKLKTTVAALISIGVGDGGREGARAPKNSGKNFSGNFYVKSGIFRAKIM